MRDNPGGELDPAVNDRRRSKNSSSIKAMVNAAKWRANCKLAASKSKTKYKA